MIEPNPCKNCNGEGQCDIQDQWAIFGKPENVNDPCEAFQPKKELKNGMALLENNLRDMGLPEELIVLSVENWKFDSLHSKHTESEQ